MYIRIWHAKQFLKNKILKRKYTMMVYNTLYSIKVLKWDGM